MFLQYRRHTSFSPRTDFVFLSKYGSRSSIGVSHLVGHSLNTYLNLVFADDGDWLVLANVTVKSFKFRMVAVYASNIAAEKVYFLAVSLFLDHPERIVLVDDWNAIFDPKTDRVGRGARGSGRRETSLIDLMARYYSVDRFRAILGNVSKDVIILLKKGNRYVWEDLDDFRPITLLNTEFKILAWVLANFLQLVISDLIRPEQNYAMKGRSIQNN